jgi:NitT/TauT family transport system substrate-binding protein
MMRRLYAAPRLLALFTAISVGTACAGQDATPEADGAPATEVTQTGLLPFFVTAWPTVIAKREGFFQERQLNVSFVWGFEGPQIFAGGRAEVLLDSSESALLMQNRGLDVVAFYPLVTRMTSWLVASKDIGTPTALAGETVGVSAIPSTDHFLTVKFLENFGLSQDDVDYVRIGEAQILPAIDSGHVAAASLDEALAFKASKTGNYTVLAESEDFGPYPWAILHAERSWIEENPAAARGYVEAVYEAVQFILDPANKEQVVQDIVAESEGGADQASVEDAYDLVLSRPETYRTTPLTVADVEPAAEALRFAGEQGEIGQPDLQRYLEMTYFAEVVG